MKLRGKKLSNTNLEICIIPRGNGEDIVFKCQAVIDMDDFDKLCPEPKIPIRRVRDQKIEDVEDPLYKGLSALHAEKRINYLILKSLEATEDLEWETVNMSDSETWKNYQKELKDSGFSMIEINRIVQSVMIANCLSESRLEEARKAFLAGLDRDLLESSSPNGEHLSIVSGAPVKD